MTLSRVAGQGRGYAVIQDQPSSDNDYTAAIFVCGEWQHTGGFGDWYEFEFRVGSSTERLQFDEGQRVYRFSPDYSLGTLMTADGWDKKDVGPARGDVTISESENVAALWYRVRVSTTYPT